MNDLYFPVLKMAGLTEVGVCSMKNHCSSNRSREDFCRKCSAEMTTSGLGEADFEVNDCQFTQCCSTDLCNLSEFSVNSDPITVRNATLQSISEYTLNPAIAASNVTYTRSAKSCFEYSRMDENNRAE